MPDTGWMYAAIVTTDTGLVDWHPTDTPTYTLQEAAELASDEILCIHEDDSQHYLKLTDFRCIATDLAPVYPASITVTGVEVLTDPVWFPEAGGGDP